MAIRVETWDSFDQAAPALNGLQGNPFLAPDWLRTYCESEQPRERLLLMGFYREEELVAFAPMRLRRLAGGLVVARFAGEGRSDYQGIAGEASAEVFAAFRQTLRLAGRSVVLSAADVAGDDALAALLQNAGAEAIALYPCPYRDLSEAAPPDSKSNRKFQGRIPSYYKRLGELGKVTFQVLDFDTERKASMEWLPGLWDLHDRRHGARRNAWKADHNRKFLSRYLESSERTNFLGFLTQLDGRPVAFDLGFREGRTFHLYIPAFDPELEKYRLGHVNRWLTFQECKRMGIEHYDFSRGDSFAKRVWSHGARTNYLFVMPLDDSLMARAGAAYLASMARLKAWGRAKGINERVGRVLAFATQQRP